MQRRSFLAGLSTVGVGAVAGCTGTPDAGSQATPTPSAEVQAHIDAASESFSTAADQLDSADAVYDNLQTAVSYDKERVNIALEDGQAELDAARERRLTEKQEAQIEYLEQFSTAIGAAVAGYNAFLKMLEHVDVAASYESADRREATTAELEDAQTDRDTADEELTAAIDAVEAMREQAVELELQLSLVDWRQRIELTAAVVVTWEPTLVALGEETRGRWDYNDTADAIRNGDYEDAVDFAASAMTHFEKAQGKYRDAEDIAETDLRQTMIRWGCQAGNLYKAAEHLQVAALEYREGNTRNGNEESQAAEADANASC